MSKALAFTATAVFLLSLLGTLLASGNLNRPVAIAPNENRGPYIPYPAAPPATPRAPVAGQLIGAALNLYHTEHLHLYHDALEQMSDAGLNAVQIVTPMFQDNGASPTVELRRGKGRGPDMADIVSLLAHAKALGMHTMLMPQVNFTHPRGNEWRGKLQPEHWDPWWQSYHQSIDEFLAVAEANHVDLFVVGCELLTTHTPEHQDRWRELIAHARQNFTGKLTYSTTWDTYHKVGFWDDLDVVGVSGYWDITTLAKDPDHPTDQELIQRWTEIRQRLLAYAQSQKKPVLLTEVGYPSLPWALTKPWNYINKDNLPPDPDAQARGYAAFIATWHDAIGPDAASTTTDPWQGPQPVGVFFHKWDPYHRGGPDDYGYGVAGKPAYQHLKNWLNNPPITHTRQP